MSVVLLLWAYAELSWQPWRVKLVGVADSTMSFCLLVILLCGALVIDPVENSAWDGTSQFLVFFFSCLFLGLLVPISAGLKKLLYKRKRYDFFLCHHKGGGGAHARWVEMLLRQQTNGEIFLDSDCLEDLENIFDMVKSDTKNVLVLLTQETLQRMWCAGEIASAWKNGVNIVKLVCGDFVEFNDAFFSEQLPQYFREEQLAELAKGGISYEDIESAYRHLATVPSVAFPRDGSIADQMEAAKKVVRKCAGLQLSDHVPAQFSTWLPTLLGRQISRQDVAAHSPDGIMKKLSQKNCVKFEDKSVKTSARATPTRPVVVLGDGLTPETVVSCRILQALLQRESELGIDTCTVRQSLTEEELAGCISAKYVFVLLTNGLMSNPAAMALVTLLAKQEKGPEFVPCTLDRSFCFPSVTFYADIVNGTALSVDFVAAMRACMEEVHIAPTLKGTLELSDIADAYKELFTKLALPFSPQASKDVINVEVQGLLRRIKSAQSFVQRNRAQEHNEDDYANIV